MMPAPPTNSFDYLTQVQRRASKLGGQKPTEWMHWNYRQALERSRV